MSVCANCGATISDGALFCGECGVRVKPLNTLSEAVDNEHTVTITSGKKGWPIAGLKCTVYVNGSSLGIVPTGQTVTTRSATDFVDIEIMFTWRALFFKNFLSLLMRLKLNISENPTVIFDLHRNFWNTLFVIDASVTGAEILEQRYSAHIVSIVKTVCDPLPEAIVNSDISHKFIISFTTNAYSGGIVVNGVNLGLIPGKHSMITQVYSNNADVTIGNVSMILRIYDDVNIMVSASGETTVTGADVIEKRFLK